MVFNDVLDHALNQITMLYSEPVWILCYKSSKILLQTRLLDKKSETVYKMAK